MGQLHHSTAEHKYKHLSATERGKIEYMSRHGSNKAQITRELGPSYNCVKQELQRGMTDQIRQNRHMEIYFADHGQTEYEKNRKHCVRRTAIETSDDFIEEVVRPPYQGAGNVCRCGHRLAEAHRRV